MKQKLPNLFKFFLPFLFVPDLSIFETWKNVITLQSDVKELIPEFYQPEMADFLVNRKLLELGTMQDGTKVNYVDLPPWADGKNNVIMSTTELTLL